MSTIFCSEISCVYQKDGRCNLNAIRDHTVQRPNISGCFYFRNKSEVLSKSEGQNQQK